MSNIPTFSLSPVTLSSREALHEILVIMGNFLLVNRTLELLSLVDVDSAVLPGITYVQSDLGKNLDRIVSDAMSGSRVMMRDESLQCSLSLHEPPSKSRPSESSSSGWLGARLGSGGAQKGMIEQWLLPILIDPRSSQLLDVERVQRCLFELLDLLRNNLDHFPSLSAPPQLEVQVQSAKYASAGSLQSVLGGIRPPPIF